MSWSQPSLGVPGQRHGAAVHDRETTVMHHIETVIGSNQRMQHSRSRTRNDCADGRLADQELLRRDYTGRQLKPMHSRPSSQ